jgi:hypothetical protein
MVESSSVAAASLPPQRDAWGNFLPASSVGNVRYRDSSFYGAPVGGTVADLPDDGVRATTLTPSYAAGSGDPSHYPFPQQQRPTYSVNHQLTPTVPAGGAGGGLSPQTQQQAPPAPLYIAHIQPSWSDQRSIVNRGVSRPGGGDQDPYGFPPPPRAQTMGPPPPMRNQQQPQHPQQQQQQQQQQPQSNGLSPTVSTYRPSNSRSDGYLPPAALHMSAVPSTSAASESYNRPSPSTSAASGGQLAGTLPAAGSALSAAGTPTANMVFGLRHLLNHPSPPPSSAAQGYVKSATALRQPSSGAVDSGGAGGAASLHKNSVTAGEITGVIPMSVKEVLTGHVGPSPSDDGEAGGNGEGWRAKKRRGIDGMLRASNDWDTPLEMRILSEEDVFELFELSVPGLEGLARLSYSRRC